MWCCMLSIVIEFYHFQIEEENVEQIFEYYLAEDLRSVSQISGEIKLVIVNVLS